VEFSQRLDAVVTFYPTQLEIVALKLNPKAFPTMRMQFDLIPY
jgi:hypothetical protein